MADEAGEGPAWWELRLDVGGAGWAGRLWEDHGAVAVTTADDGLVATFAGREAAAAARAAVGDGEVRPAPGEAEWRDVWRAWARPVVAGRLVVRPAWLEPDPASEAGAAVVVVDPGAAWGHGGHPSTRLVLEVLSDRLRGGESLLDVGCGSGVLAVAALVLGAGHVTALDIDPAALVATRANAERNDIADRLEVGTWPLRSIRRRFDVVVANIGAAVLLELAEPLAACVERPGLLVLSGLLGRRWPEVAERFDAAPGLALVDVRHEDGWAAPVLAAGPEADVGPHGPVPARSGW